MPKRTQTTLQGLDKAEYLSTSTRNQMPFVSPRLAETYAALPPPPDGTAAIDWNALQERNATLIDVAVQAARAAAQDHRVAQARARETLRQRNGIVRALRTRHRNLRQSFRGTYGAEALPLVGLDEPLARAYNDVREQCRDAVVQMRHPSLPARLGEPLNDQSPLDLEKLAAGMEGDLDAFEAAVAQLIEDRKQRDEALVTKREAERRLRVVNTNIARVQEGYYRVAGLDELADRIRLTIPRPSPSESEEPTEPAGDAGDVTETRQP